MTLVLKIKDHWYTIRTYVSPYAPFCTWATEGTYIGPTLPAAPPEELQALFDDFPCTLKKNLMHLMESSVSIALSGNDPNL